MTANLTASPNMQMPDRWTSADMVFHDLYEQIASLKLMPGAKISEAEIAARFGISRQPVRDAFSRLDNMGLVNIRPQKATTVKKFSLKSIEQARFVRLSIELEVVRRAAETWDGTQKIQVEDNLAAQHKAMDEGDAVGFHAHDYEFHKIFCHAVGTDFAVEIISANKAKVDRLCMLSLNKGSSRMGQLIKDHEQLYAAISTGDTKAVQEVTRLHLSRLDGTIAEIYRTQGQYFED